MFASNVAFNDTYLLCVFQSTLRQDKDRAMTTKTKAEDKTNGQVTDTFKGGYGYLKG